MKPSTYNGNKPENCLRLLTKLFHLVLSTGTVIVKEGVAAKHKITFSEKK